MSQIWLKVVQVTLFIGVMFGSIWVSRVTEYPINPYIIGAWSFMAAYGFTLAYDNLSNERVRLGRVFSRLRVHKQPD